jgi:ParB family chromosome partitioning protein
LNDAPVRIVDLTDAQALETSIVETLQRRDVHPLEEAQGFAALLKLEEPRYSVEQIAAKCAKSPGYVASRLRLTELAPAVIEAFAKDEIGLGHALLLAKLQPRQQEEALPSCFHEQYASSKPKRILLPVRNLREWIERNILLELAIAPFSKDDASLLPEAGSCVECPKRTGHNVLLFGDMGAKHDACTDPQCYSAKVDAHVKQTVAAKPKLVQISTAFGVAKEGSATVPRNKYVAIRGDKPQKGQRDWPEYKTCKSMTEAIVTEGSEKGELRRVCTNPECPVHQAKKRQQKPDRADASFRAEQEKRRREEALAQATGLRVLEAVSASVPVRLMKRDLLFVAERLTAVLDERRVAVLLRQHSIGKPRNSEAPAKLLSAFLRKAEEGALGRVLVETAILQSMTAENDSARGLREAAQHYKVDVEAITTKVKQEFAAKEKARNTKKAPPKPAPKPQPKTTKKTAA